MRPVLGQMAKRGTAETEAKGGIDAARFVGTIRRMLSTPPTPHKSKKTKGTAPKRAHRSSGKSKG